MLFLRKIERTKWLTPDDTSWLESGDIPADPLGDLATTGNAFSLWHIEEDRSNFDRVVAGFASKLGNPRNFGYSLFRQEVLTNLGLAVNKTTGDSFDQEVNEKWHWEVVHVSADRLLELAKALFPLSDGRDVVLGPTIEQLIVDAISKRRIRFDGLQQTMKVKIRPLL